MLRWRPLHITILSFGSITSPAWAADPPLCPSATAATQAASTDTQSQPRPQKGNKPATTPTPKGRKPEIGTGAATISADHANLGVDGSGTLRGHVVVHESDKEIRAEELEYNSKANSVRTDSGLEYDDPVIHMTGNGGNYSPAQGADVRAATFDMKQRAARGSADSMQLTPLGVIDLKGVKFTTCPRTEEAWKLRASSITLDTRSQIGVARSTRVDFEGVPIFYLPWLSFPLGNERKSGFLFPTIGNSSRSGAILAVPYYWNIAPNADLTFEPTLYSRRGVDVGGDFRYLSSFDHGELTWNFLPHDSVYGSSRDRVKIFNAMELPANFRFTVNAESVSDTSYFEDFAQGPEGTSTAFLQQQALVTYRDEHWRIDGQIQHYQTTDITLPATQRPYARLPSLAVSADYALGSAEQLRYGFQSEIVNFHRDLGVDVVSCNQSTGINPCVDGWRVDLMPQATLNFDAPGYFIRPGVAWRATQYQLSDTNVGENRSPSRSVPIASFDTGLIFERTAGSHDQRRVTLEPRLLYLYVPYRNQDQLPLFDTALPDLDPVELFRNNRYVGADRVGDANQVSVGVTSRLLDAHNGRQFLTATFGQTYYFSNPRVLLPGEVPRTDNRSDFVAQLALTAFQDWSADMGIQWNPQTSQSERSQVNIQYKPANNAVINLGYRYQRNGQVQAPEPQVPGQPAPEPPEPVQQAEFSGAWPIADTWNVFARGVYSITDHKPLERFAGFEYRACCWRVRLGGRSFVTKRTGAQDTGVYLQLELTGLASVGSASDSFLTEAIRGYVPTESAISKTRTR